MLWPTVPSSSDDVGQDERRLGDHAARGLVRLAHRHADGAHAEAVDLRMPARSRIASARGALVAERERRGVGRRIGRWKRRAERERLAASARARAGASSVRRASSTVGDVALRHPPQHEIRLDHALEPFAAAAHDLHVRRLEDEAARANRRPPTPTCSTRKFSSSVGRSAVALPSSVCRRQTNPGDASASALMRSRLLTKSAITGDSSGALMIADVQLREVIAGHRLLLALTMRFGERAQGASSAMRQLLPVLWNSTRPSPPFGFLK